jgi:hypothetical protein
VRDGRRRIHHVATTRTRPMVFGRHAQASLASSRTADLVHVSSTRLLSTTTVRKAEKRSSDGPMSAYDARVNAELLRDDPHQRGEDSNF